MTMLFVCRRMWAFSVLTPVLSSRCFTDSPNKQCVSDCTVSKSIISNGSLWATIVATLLIGYLDSFGGMSARLDDWFSLFLPILSLLSKNPPEFIVRHLILYEGKYKKE